MNHGGVPHDLDSTRKLLLHGEVTSCRLVPQGSNDTFLALLQGDSGEQTNAIYKPRRGEAPLWDFPDGTLYLREYAAYLFAEALRWHFIPPTVVREGPYGVGSMQLFVEHAQRESYFSLRDSGKHDLELQRICLFDWLSNNADRKASHCLLGSDGRIWGIDQGLTFHATPKLRTVIWDFSDGPIRQELLADVERLLTCLEQGNTPAQDLEEVLEAGEIAALKARMRQALTSPTFPLPSDSRRSVPWPMF